MTDDNKVGTTGTLGGGNTSPPPKQRKTRRFCLTLNNWTVEEYQHIAQTFFCHGKEWIIGKEIGEKKTPHLQMYIEFKNARSFAAVKKLTNDRCHIEKAKGNREHNRIYCSKDGDFEGNMFAPVIEETHEEETKRLILEQEYGDLVWYEWQEKLLTLINKFRDPRKIHWFWEPNGNLGKSFIAKWIAMEYPECVLGNGKGHDVFHQICKMKYPENEKLRGRNPSIIILDAPRSAQGYIDYAALECMKNGLFYSGKFKGGQCFYPKCHVVVFANEQPKVTNIMSADKWDIHRVKRSKRYSPAMELLSEEGDANWESPEDEQY